MKKLYTPEAVQTEQTKVDALYAKMTPVQRAITLAWMQGLLTARAA